MSPLKLLPRIASPGQLEATTSEGTMPSQGRVCLAHRAGEPDFNALPFF